MHVVGKLVLEMDSLMRGVQIHANCCDYVVTLEGSVRNEEGRRQAERDAWCLFAVDGVGQSNRGAQMMPVRLARLAVGEGGYLRSKPRRHGTIPR